MNKIKLFITAFWLLLLSAGVSGQSGLCLDFEDLTPGDRFGSSSDLMAGAVFYEKSGLEISLDSFYYPNGTSGYFDLIIENSQTFDSSRNGVSLFPSNLNLRFNLDSLPAEEKKICFDFHYLGGDINFSLNGEQALIFSSFEEFLNVQTEAYQDIDLDITALSSDQTRGTLCISGKAIQEVLIGGQELVLDNFCVVMKEESSCQFGDLRVEPYPCTPNGVFYLDVTFESSLDSGQYFFLVNNQSFGPFDYSLDSFPTLGPIQVYGDSFYEVKVFDADFPDCKASTVLEYNCTDFCGLTDLEVVAELCEGDSLARIELDFKAIIPTLAHSSFKVWIDSLEFNEMSLLNLPYTLEIPATLLQDEETPFTICIPTDPLTGEECCVSGVIRVKRCEKSCPIQQLNAEIVDCLPNGNYSIYIETLVADSLQNHRVKVKVEGEEIGVFPLDTPGLFLEDVFVLTDAQEFELSVCWLSKDEEPLDACCQTVLLHKDQCKDSLTPEEECFSFDDLDHLSFSGEDYLPGAEVFSYQQISFRLFPLQNLDWSSSQGALTITSAEEFPNFAAASGQSLYLEAIATALIFNEFEADVDKVSLDYYNLGSHLNISANGSPIQILSGLATGTYSLGNSVEVFIEVNPEKPDQGRMTFKGNISALLLGGEALLVDNLCINQKEEPGEISDVQVVPTECDDTGQFYLNLDFKYQNTSDYFIVAGANDTRERFAYQDLPIKFGPFNGPISQELVWDIYDGQKDHCVARAAFGPYDCQMPCDTIQVETYDVECDPNTGRYHFTLEVKGLDPGTVLSLGNGSGFIKRFEYSGQPIRINEVPLPGGRFDHLSLCAGLQANDTYDCCIDFEVEVDCIPDCQIEAIEVFDIECLQDGTYSLSLKARGENSAVGIYLLQTRLGFETRFKLEGNEARITNIPLPGNLGLQEQIKICKVSEDTAEGVLSHCCFELEFQVECREDCQLGEVRLFDFECDSDSTYSVSLKVEAAEILFGEVLYLKTSGGFEFRFEWQGEAVRLEGIPKSPDQQADQMVVCAPNFPNCCLDKEYLIECGTTKECFIGELFTEVSPCEADGSFFINLDFRHENTSEGFEVYLDDQPLGGYRYEDLPLEVGPILPEPNASGRYEIKVKDWEKDCFASTTVEACTEADGCPFASVELLAEDCQDGFFSVTAEIALANKKDGEFLVFAEGELFGPYRYSQDQRIEFGPFRGDGQTSYDFLFVDLNDPTCFLFQEIGIVDCQEEEFCEINNLQVEVVHCNEDGSYQVLLDLEYNGTDNEFFDLFTSDGNRVGSYRLDELPLQIDIFFPNDSIIQNLAVCINDQPDCCTETQVDVPSCEDDCQGLTFQAIPMACDSSGQFNILLDVDLDLAVIYPILLKVNGAFYDSIEISHPSFEIGPFPADSSYSITLIDAWHPNCTSTFDLGEVDCDQEEDEVWPGDANQDNIANHLDLLNLGIAWGADGPARTLSGSRWTGVPASSWGRLFSTSLGSGDIKHADCNGDGVINEEDISVIRKNYNLRNGMVEEAPVIPGTDLDPPVFFEVPEDQGLPDSGYFNIPIILGSEDQPLSDIYGVAFTIEFDPDVIDPNDIEITFPTSWLGDPGVNLQSISYKYQGQGKLEIAITRTDQNEVSGYGPVAMFRGIRDDIVGRTESQMDINRGFAVNAQQNLIRLNGIQKTVKFKPSLVNQKYGFIDLKKGMRVYPNPASSIINIDNFYGVPIDALQILTPNGQVMSPRYEAVNSLNISELPDGLYLIRVEIAGYIIHQKLLKSKSW